jgi:xanthine dehydrogenase accessory factor
VESILDTLLPLFHEERSNDRPCALALLVETAGSTYRKAGAMMLIARDGRYAGLLSGGCLEGDLREHAVGVIDTGEPRVVSYDLRGPDDLLWGIGAGCEGAMRMLLLRVGPEQQWEPLAHLQAAHAAHRRTAVAVVVEPGGTACPAGRVYRPDDAPPALRSALEGAAARDEPGWLHSPELAARLFVLPLALPPRLLLLGAGPDAAPVVDIAVRVGFKVVLVDHRPAYASPERFAGAERVLQARPGDLAPRLAGQSFDAAVVMSHHLESDLGWLRYLADGAIPYVGLLGPAARRERLLADLGAAAERLRPRLRAPVGLALGGRSPEAIALAIVAEVHAFIHGLEGRPFSASAGQAQA